MIDTHAHLHSRELRHDLEGVLGRARASGVEAIIEVGLDAATSLAAADLARVTPGIFAAVGLHPTSRPADGPADLARIEELACRHPGRVVAVGEIGLDFYWKDVEPEEQRPRLEGQLELAGRLGLPVIIHCRDALRELLALLDARGALPAGVFHCFDGEAAEAERVLDLGFHISFTGNVTYPKRSGLQEAARLVPLERLLLETDCPYMAPQPVRGRRNEPAFAAHTLGFLAGLKGISAAELEAATTANACRLFALDPAWRLAGALGKG